MLFQSKAYSQSRALTLDLSEEDLQKALQNGVYVETT
jgi:hypothetical protein